MEPDFSMSQRQAIQTILLFPTPVTFLLGPPGFGKTTVIRQVVRKIRETKPNAKISIVAMSTVAAEIIGEIDGIRATTFHKWWCLGKGSLRLHRDPSYIIGSLRKTKPQPPLDTEYQILDEASMLAYVIYTNMNTILQEYRNNRNEEFGGMKIILVGDPLQLPPVPADKGPGLDRDEQFETHSVLDYYNRYATYCILKEPHRNKDMEFQKMVRGFVSNKEDTRKASLVTLNERHHIPGIQTIPEIVSYAIRNNAIVAAHTNLVVNQLINEFKRRFEKMDRHRFQIPPYRRLFGDEDIISLDLNDPKQKARENIEREEKAIAEERKRFYNDGTIFEGQVVQLRATFKTLNQKEVHVGELCTFVEFREDEGVCVLHRKTNDEELHIGEYEGSSEYWEELKWMGYPFIPANACTNHLLQGSTIHGKLVFYSDIHGDIHGTVPFHLYVASSRVTESSNFVITHTIDKYKLSSRAVQSKLDQIWSLTYMQDYPQV